MARKCPSCKKQVGVAAEKCWNCQTRLEGVAVQKQASMAKVILKSWNVDDGQYGWASILAGGAGFFFFLLIPIFSIAGIIFGFIAIFKGSYLKGLIGIVISIVSAIYIMT